MSFQGIVIFVGPPGSGKGTISKICSEKLDWAQLSTGDLCRKHIAEQTDIGKEIDFAIKSGKLVSDSVISAMVFDWLKQSSLKSDRVIFDGYPRTVAQAEGLHNFLQQGDLVKCEVKIIKFAVSDDVVIERICGRLVCGKCQAIYSKSGASCLQPKNDRVCDKCDGLLVRRSDDQVDVVKERLAGYENHEKALVGALGLLGYSVETLDADRDTEVIFEDLKKILCI